MNYSPRFVAAGALALWLAGQSAAQADVKMPAIFGDHMVLQQDMALPVWGTAEPGEAVTVTVGSESAKATAGADGKWSVKLPALPTNGQAVTMTVTGNNAVTFHEVLNDKTITINAAGKKNTVTFQDVLIGEVWICSGQSNMEFSLRGAHDAATELPAATDPQLRLFVVAHNAAHTPAADVAGKWFVCAPDPVTNFTAVGYFFGKELREKLKRPVGLIETNWGGTPAEAWTSLDGLKKDPALVHYADAWNQIDAKYAAAAASYPAEKSAYDKAMEEWNELHAKQYNQAMDEWKQAAAKAAAAKASPPPRSTPPPGQPKRLQDPAGGPGAPATLYNGMIAPIEPYAMRGVIWYQGEANANNVARAQEYKKLFPRMIEDWRANWGEGDFPFLFVQLAAFHADDTDSWPELRESQAETLSLPKTGMATAIDIGLPGNIHPMDKHDVGKRLALVARHVAYGEDLVYSGPIFKGVKKEPKALRVTFDDVGGGLKIAESPWVRPQLAPMLPVDHLVGFELAGADGKWQPADAKIDGNELVVSSASVADPVEVRYDWKAYAEGNLYNKEGLPATPFDGKTQ